MNKFLRLSFLLINSIGIMFNIPFVLKILLLRFLIYGIQTKRKMDTNPTINIANFNLSRLIVLLMYPSNDMINSCFNWSRAGVIVSKISSKTLSFKLTEETCLKKFVLVDRWFLIGTGLPTCIKSFDSIFRILNNCCNSYSQPLFKESIWNCLTILNRWEKHLITFTYFFWRLLNCKVRLTNISKIVWSEGFNVLFKCARQVCF